MTDQQPKPMSVEDAMRRAMAIACERQEYEPLQLAASLASVAECARLDERTKTLARFKELVEDYEERCQNLSAAIDIRDLIQSLEESEKA